MATEDWTDEALDGLREVGDRAADELASHLGAQFPRLVHEIVETLSLNGESPPPGLPPRLRDFLEDQAALPPFADVARIERGQRFFSRFGPQIVLALVCGALPECYAAARGAQILGLSQRLRRYTHRRVLETAQLVLDVMAPGGLAPQGRGVRTVQKVRLIHAISRLHLVRSPNYQQAWGLPVNQEDMLGTLMAFSSVVLAALPRLGIRPTAEEADAYLHCWLVIGHLLGVDARYFPADPEEAQAFSAIVRRRHHGPTEAGQGMTQALVQLMEQAVPGTILDGFVAVLIRHLVGDRVADILGLPREDWTRALLWPLRLTNSLLDAVCDAAPPLGRATELFSRRFLEGVYIAELGAEPGRFYVPPQLVERWGLTQSPLPMPAVATPARTIITS